MYIIYVYSIAQLCYVVYVVYIIHMQGPVIMFQIALAILKVRTCTWDNVHVSDIACTRCKLTR